MLRPAGTSEPRRICTGCHLTGEQTHLGSSHAIRTTPSCGLAAALALTATACGPSDDTAGDKPARRRSAAPGTGGGDAPPDLADKLKEHGVDVDDWKDGGWKDWDKDDAGSVRPRTSSTR